ncbi:UDP-glucose 4-epimerase family protein [Pseudomonas argentinensis]|uniref:UDP-glucose 4-epimerase family protein n=1 Tax=Phytopseudomonas argentinensis TaxID=289370 RepID=UPI0008A98B1E|nr:SDR family oxidoreductase [Pseudomonas argentinensis]
MRVLLTGATGFVGRGLLKRLSTQGGLQLRAAVRRQESAFPESVTVVQVADLRGDTDWRQALEGVEAVIHSAARVHVMDDQAKDPLAEFRAVNVAGTLNLARQAVSAGVKRFVFISSIKVNGEGTASGKPYTADDTPMPVDPYGISKLEAEQGLQALSQETGMEVVIIRPVLVYGPGVKANFRSMMSWLRKGIPLPLGATGNKRSLVAVDNLVDLIATCIDHPAAANQTFLVSDGEDLSTTQLLQRMGKALGRPARLLPVPASLLQAGAAMLGKRAIAQRLCGSLQVDIGKTRELLGWAPPVSVDDALRKTARAFEAG